MASVLSCKFVEEKNLSKSAPGKRCADATQNAAIPSGIARLCNAAWCRFPMDLFNEFAIQDTRASQCVRDLIDDTPWLA